MKILLIGEFSGLHSNLRDGLITLGHDVAMASSGDGWKQFQSDIDLGKTHFKGYLGKIERALNVFLKIKNLHQYDVIQLIQYHSAHRYINRQFIQYLQRKNKNIFTLVAGASPIATKYNLQHFPYSPYHIGGDEKEQCADMAKLVALRLKKSTLKDEMSTLKHFKGVIPVAFSYSKPFEGMIQNLYKIIPMPINHEIYHPYKKGSQCEKIKILYGLNRPCDKGHYYIKNALDQLLESHGEYIDMDFVTRLPYKEYLDRVNQCDILVDQCKSLGYGMNALLGLAMGKAVLSGAEKIALDYMGIADCPIINITPSVEDIYNKLVRLVENPFSISEIGIKSRSYAEEYHNHISVAKQYIAAWSK